MNTTLIKKISQITGKRHVDSGLPQAKKEKIISRHLNTSKYNFVGFVDRTNDVVLMPRYYNVRNKLGQFACIEG